MRATGPTNALIAIVGEAPGEQEELRGMPFCGPSGTMLDNTLHSVGLMRTTCFVTNVCRVRPPDNEIGEWWSDNKKSPHKGWERVRDRWVHPNIAGGLKQLEAELGLVKPRIVIALGGLALWALAGHSGILKWRGSRLAPPDREFTVLPTIHPAAVLRQMELLPVFKMDLKRVKNILEGKQTPRAYNFTIAPGFEEVKSYLEGLLSLADKGPLTLAGDIETRAGFITCVGFATNPTDATCIPLITSNHSSPFYWEDPSEEAAILLLIRKLFLHPNILHIGQNYLYDCQYFYRHFGAVPSRVGDTMIGHHSIYSTLRKGLDFLSSMYCHDHVYWKDESKDWDPKIGERQLWTYNCLAGTTPVLTIGSRYKPLADIQPGDALLAFEETGSDKRYARRLRTAFVLNKWSSIKEVVRYTFSDGTFLDATTEHRIISTTGNDSRAPFRWKTCGELKLGDKVVSIGKPWTLGNDYEDAWFAGILDGEGTVMISRSDEKAYPRIGFSQKPGKVLNRALAVLSRHGFSVRLSPKPSATYVDINGGLAEQLRLLGLFYTSRIAQNFINTADTEGLSGFAGLTRPYLVGKSVLGELPVFDIETTQGTFIAGGLVVHNCKDCVTTIEAWNGITAERDKQNLQPHFAFQQSLFFPVLRIMLRGIKVDKARRAILRNELLEAAMARQEKLDWVVGHHLNPKSSKQLLQFFYHDMKIPGVKNIRTDKLSSDSASLEQISNYEPLLSPVTQLIAELRSIGVFLSTFIEAQDDIDGRMRSSFAIAGPTTFRFASSQNAFNSGMNFQNLPKEEKQKLTRAHDYISLPNIRSLFIPDPGFEFFDMDLDRADLQVVVWEANDADLKFALREGLDMHLFNARSVWALPIPLDELRESHPDFPKWKKKYAKFRQLAKQAVHATNYGVGDRKLAQTIGITQSAARDFKTKWFRAHPGIHTWHKRVEEQARSRGFVENILGARLYIMGRFDLPEALAWGPQSTVAGVINRALVAIDAEEQRGGSPIQLLLQVHDSLAGQFPASQRESCLSTLNRLGRVELPYPDPLVIPVGIKTSTSSWGECE